LAEMIVEWKWKQRIERTVVKRVWQRKGKSSENEFKQIVTEVSREKSWVPQRKKLFYMSGIEDPHSHGLDWIIVKEKP
jgi:hypothetical protein